LRLRSDRFGIEPEITSKIARLGFRVYEVPISYHGRDYWEGKKIGWKDGVSAVWTILRYAFVDDEENENAGYRILQRMQKVSRYNRWMWSQLERFVGRRVLEVGSGVGNMTRLMLGRERVIATDLSEKYLQILHHLFDDYPHVTVDRFDLNEPPPAAVVGDGSTLRFQLVAVVCRDGDEDEPGFWESNGYHILGDPWLEQRYWGD